MYYKIIVLVSVIIISFFVTMGFNNKNNLQQKEIDLILAGNVEQNLRDETNDALKKQIKTDVGNVLNKKTNSKDIYMGNNNKKIINHDAEGGFSYSSFQNSMRSGAEWGKAGINEYDLKEPDVQSNYTFGLNKQKVYNGFDNYNKDGDFGIGDTSDAKVQENYRYMRTALAQLQNVISNSQKSNIDIDGGVDKEILVHAKSKIINPSFVYGYIESKEPIQLNNGIVPVYKKTLPKIEVGINESKNNINSNNENLEFNF